MATIDEMHERIRALYRSVESGGTIGVPLALRVMEFVWRAKEYAAAAKIVSDDSPQLALAIIQLSGQAIELALKGCWAAAGFKPPRDTAKGHNLVHLFSKVEERGFQATDIQRSTVVLVGHWYYEDLGTNTRFKARYPVPRDERVGGSMPTAEMVSELVEALTAHAHIINADGLMKLGYSENDLPKW